MKQIKIIGTGVLDIKEIDKLKEFQQKYEIQRTKTIGNPRKRVRNE